MRTKSFSELTADEFALFARFALAHGDPALFAVPEKLADVLGGSLFQQGDGFLVLFDQGRPKAAVGCIVRDVERKGTAYLAGVAADPEEISLFPLLLEKAIAYLERQKPGAVTLGLPTGLSFLEPEILKSRFRRSDRALILRREEKSGGQNQPLLRRTPVPDLALEELSADNAREFRMIQNRAFRDTVNAAVLTERDVTELLARRKKTSSLGRFAGVATLHGEPVGIYELEIRDESAWIETIGIDPDFREKGLGRALLSGLLENVRGKVKAVELIVMESNKSAVRLYLSSGFSLNRIRATWYLLAR